MANKNIVVGEILIPTDVGEEYLIRIKLSPDYTPQGSYVGVLETEDTDTVVTVEELSKLRDACSQAIHLLQNDRALENFRVKQILDNLSTEEIGLLRKHFQQH